MNKYLASFLKSVVLTGITIGVSAIGGPAAGLVTPLAAMLVKYIGDNWHTD